MVRHDDFWRLKASRGDGSCGWRAAWNVVGVVVASSPECCTRFLPFSCDKAGKTQDPDAGGLVYALEALLFVGKEVENCRMEVVQVSLT